ncbi:Trk K+ transport system, NAD-binding component [Micromonospora echinaurantiaca]|uniref:Trk K+ transport system, NAD-binding component n=2 Tax=Micromonospora echinaurantiaca TaxID=47857 RepID=A0A1C5K3Y2_9ACTN|nr:Trk K+ transport system, NAD-binding component [Micromonospora echinaurantiaca]
MPGRYEPDGVAQCGGADYDSGMGEPWRDRARRAVEWNWRLRSTGDARPHYVICGRDALAYYVAKALLETELPAGGARVTVVVPERYRVDGPDVAGLRGVRVVRSDRLDVPTFQAAGLAGASGLALLHQDDVGNLHAALCAQAVDDEVRQVLRMFNNTLADGVRTLLKARVEVLSDAEMAAPAFVAAALGEVDPTHFQHRDRTLRVARRADVREQDVVCGLADLSDPQRVRLLPADQTTADLVLAEATGQPPGTEVAARRLVRARRRRRPVAVTVRAIRGFATRKIGIAVMLVLGLIAVLGALISRAEDVSQLEAIYLTLVTTLSGADPDTTKPPDAQVMQVVLNLAGLALIPLITAVVVDGIVNARLALHTGRLQSEHSEHVVVVGLGNVGTRVMAQLREYDVEVVAIDKNPEPRGATLARQLEVPLIVGDAALPETLEAAAIRDCQALVVVSTDDVANLEAALAARDVREDLRVVLRLFDGDFAERVEEAFGIGVSRSVSYLAAPAFTGALTERAVIVTIPVGRHALPVAEVPVAAGSELDGRPLSAASRDGQVRLIARTPAGGGRTSWRDLDPRQVIFAGDRLTVVARRAGLDWLTRQCAPPAPPARPVPTSRSAALPRAASPPTPGAPNVPPSGGGVLPGQPADRPGPVSAPPAGNGGPPTGPVPDDGGSARHPDGTGQPA